MVTKLILGDALEVLKTFDSQTFDMVFADPPYFLSSTDGISVRGGKQVPVNKGEWDKPIPLEEKHVFNKEWIRECRRVLKPEGTIWVCGSMHNIFSVGMALEEEGYKILNNITWHKLNPPPNLACRCFTHSTENIIWARPYPKIGHYFNYALMKERNDGTQMKDMWSGVSATRKERTFGYHPTQKPEYLLERIILASTKEGDLILDPFAGSGTTLVVAEKLGRNSVGIDKEQEYIDIATKRLGAIKDGATKTN